LLAAAVAVLLPWQAYGKDEVPAEGAFMSPQVVRDLYYGDVLFHFYQDDFFGSITRLSAAQTFGRLGQQQDEAELLKGALYLSLGQHVEAGRIFRSLLNGNVGDDVRNRAWFYLAKVWYQRNYLSDSEAALMSIKGSLPAPLEGERLLLHAQVLMYQGRYEEAIHLLEAWKPADDSASYARFNLGVALVRENRLEDAATLLDALGNMPVASQEMAALRDKANLALGFAWLKADRPAEARVVLERVRLQGPHSNKALLGLGWADSSEQRFKEALVPWLELQSRDLLDAAVQESHLAIPFAYSRLAANRQAADSYSHAIDLFREESVRIDQSIAAIQSGRMLDAIVENDGADAQGWYWQLAQLPDAPETRYLYHLLASNQFQEGLKNYRDLKVMQRNLADWKQSVAAFDSMIDTRRRAYSQRLPDLQAALGDVNLDALEARRNDLESRVALIERENDVVGLAGAAEQERWARIQRIEAVLAKADATDPAVVEMREKTRMLRGVVYWDLNAGYKARLWKERKQLRELDVALKDARRHRILVDRAKNESPQRTEEFAASVEQLNPRLLSLASRLDAAATAQGSYLASIATAELQAQRQRLASYSMQAQFALASIYDRAVSSPAVAQGISP
jgi:Tetratricopeptide repeat